MAAFLWYVFSAGAATIAFLACAVWLAVSRCSRVSRRALLIVSMAYCVASINLFPATIKHLLARGYAPLAAGDVPSGHTAVVLLGSGNHLARDWDGGRYAAVDRIGASRVAEAARVFRLTRADLIVSSGGVIEATEDSWPSGATMAEALVSLGIPRDRIIVEDRSETTHREAMLVKDLLADRPVDHVVLVTSPVHMRRSVGTFMAEGLAVIPAIAHETPAFDRWWGNLIPTDKGLEESGLAAHELMGLVVYRLRGWYK